MADQAQDALDLEHHYDSKQELPSVLVAGCEFGNPRELIRDIIGTDLPPSQPVVESINSFDWTFQTKYYSCSIKLCEATQCTIGDRCFAEQLEGVILLFSPNCSNSWSQVKSWLPYLHHLEPCVKLLVCDVCGDSSGVSRELIQSWCIENDFELIEMVPNTQDGDNPDDFDVYGVQRIRQVLYAHPWPNLALKEKPDTVSPYMKQLMEEARQNASDAGHLSSDPLSHTGMTNDELFTALHHEGEEGVESFEKLFSQLQFMKEKALGLPELERKAYAESVAMAFFDAIGGSDKDSDSS